jgi:hypothetical protein
MALSDLERGDQNLAANRCRQIPFRLADRESCMRSLEMALTAVESPRAAPSDKSCTIHSELSLVLFQFAAPAGQLGL